MRANSFVLLSGALIALGLTEIASATPLSSAVGRVNALAAAENNDLFVQVQRRGGRIAVQGGRRGFAVRRRGRNGGAGAAAAAGIIGGVLGSIVAGQAMRDPYYDPYYNEPALVYGAPAFGVPYGGDDVAYCMRKFRSYDPASGTYVGYDGRRHYCP